MRRFNQRWVNPSDLRSDGPEKVRRLEALFYMASSDLLTSSYLFRHRPTRARAHTRTRVRCVCFRLDKVRRLDKAFVYAGSNRPTYRPTYVRVGE